MAASFWVGGGASEEHNPELATVELDALVAVDGDYIVQRNPRLTCTDIQPFYCAVEIADAMPTVAENDNCDLTNLMCPTP